MLSRRVTSVVRPAQYRSTRSVGSSGTIAAQYVSTSPEPTASPAERSTAAKSTSTPTKGACSGTGCDLFQVVPDHVEVVAFLHHRAEGVLGVLRAKVGLAEEVENANPVDGLRDPGRLGEVQLAQPVDRGHHRAGSQSSGTGSDASAHRAVHACGSR